MFCHLLVILKVIFANSVDSDQSDKSPYCLPVNRFEKFARIFSRRHFQMQVFLAFEGLNRFYKDRVKKSNLSHNYLYL